MSRLATAPGSAEPKGDAAEGARRFPPACGLGFRRTSWELSQSGELSWLQARFRFEAPFRDPSFLATP